MESIAEREILPVLLGIGKKMLDNRASMIEMLAYLAYLCYIGKQGGTIKREDGSALDTAIRDIDSLWRYSADYESSSDGVSGAERSIFTDAPFSHDDYMEAFSLLPNACIQEFLDSCFYRKDPEKLFWASLAAFVPNIGDSRSLSTWALSYLPAKQRVLDYAPALLHFHFQFSQFEHYVMIEKDRFTRAFLVFRKEIEGESWKNVDILDEPPKGESFDCIRIQYRTCPVNQHFELAKDFDGISTNKGATILWGVYNNLLVTRVVCSFVPKDFNPGKSFQLDRVLYYGDVDSHFWINPCLVFKESGTIQDSVSFISFKDNLLDSHPSELESEILRNAIQHKIGASVITVPKNMVRKETLFPPFYSLRQEKMLEQGTVALSDICIGGRIQEWHKESNKKVNGLTMKSGFIKENASFLSELSPITGALPREGYILTENAILVNIASITMRRVGDRAVYACLLKVNPGDSVILPDVIFPVIVDPERYDPRFIAMILNGIREPRLDQFTSYCSSEMLDLFRIPDIPIEEQRKAVEVYFEGIRESLPGYVRNPGSKPVTYNILVITPERESFEDRFGGKMAEEHLNVIGYASDSKSLSEVLPKHFGKDVPASQRVDAVLADISAPVGDTNFVLMKIHDLDVRKFYYSTGGYSRGCIYDIFWEAVESGLVEGDEPASGMRRALDTQMSPEARLREEYREFFRSADRLDSLHPGWDLSGTVMKYLLDGRTKTPVNTVRSLLSETLCRFFRDCRAVPFCMEDGAIPSFLADGGYKDGKRNLEYKVADKGDDGTQKSEAWIRYAFVALFKLGNKESHVSRETEEMVSEAALIILMQVIRWFEGVHDRYAGGGVGFKCYRGGKECRLQAVREAAPGYFAVGDVHVGRQDGLRDGSVGVLNEQLPGEKNPRTIDGVTYTRYAGKDSFHILLQ